MGNGGGDGPVDMLFPLDKEVYEISVSAAWR